jgi:CMP-N,N'-diacetyllegionaminic acid synthase
MKTLVVIPARGGSKGLPGKNIRLLMGKPLIHYSIDFARSFFYENDICVSTDDINIIRCINEIKFEVPFLRPANLATSEAGMNDVILHALSYFENQNIKYDRVLLLQPTSPIRKLDHLKEMIHIMDQNPNLDMVVTVKKSKENPYFNLFEEENGYLTKSKKGNFLTRQSAPDVYAYSGSMYLISTKSIKEKGMSGFDKIRKYQIDDDLVNIDIDTMSDWIVLESLIKISSSK